MKKTRIVFQYNLDSTPRSQKIDRKLAIFQSFISQRLLAAAQIGLLLLKVLYLSFQIHTN